MLLALAACREPVEQRGCGLVVLPDAARVQTPDLAPRDYYHDFGDVPNGEVAEHVFRLQNTCGQAIAITRLTPSCGCTVGELRVVRDDGAVTAARSVDSEPLELPPQGIAELVMRVSTQYVRPKNSDKLLTLRITTSDGEPRFLTLEAHIRVADPFAVVPNGINLGNVPRNGIKTKSVDIVQAGEFRRRIDALAEVPPNVEATLELENRFGNDVWVLTAGFRPPLEPGTHTAAIELAVVDETGEPAAALRVPITARAGPDIQVDPLRLIAAGTPDELRALDLRASVYSLLEGLRFAVRRVLVEGDAAELLVARCEAAEPDGNGRDDRWTLHVGAGAAFSDGVFQGALSLELDDPQVPAVRVPYVLRVEGP